MFEELKEKKYGRVFLEENDSLKRIESIFDELSSKYGMDHDNIIQLLRKRQNFIAIPASLFNNELSPLENVVLYLHIKFNLSQTKIADILNRDHTTIWTTLENAKEKIKESRYNKYIVEAGDNHLIPISIFEKKKLSILESVSVYLKEKFSMSYHEIGMLLGKNDRTIWTVVNRAKKKGVN